MTSVGGVTSSETNQALTTETVDTESTETGASTAFAKILQGILVPDSSKNVSEEALFAALTLERVKTLKGDEAGAAYETLLKQIQGEMTRADGYIPYEDAARRALDEFRQSGALSDEEAEKIHAEAFGAAQLDSNTDALYDHLGDTVAMAQLSSVIGSAKALIDKYAAGTETPTSRPISLGLNAGGRLFNAYESVSSSASSTSSVVAEIKTPSGTTVDGSGGFLFKPVSDNSGKLAVLVPVELSAMAVECLLRDSSGNVIENGTHWAPGYLPNDPEHNRKKFNFNKPGGDYVDDLTVEIKLSDGRVLSYEIPDPSKRYD